MTFPIQGVPGSAGVKLIFFTLAGMGLCFGFVLNRVMMIEMFLLLLRRAYTDPRPFLLFVLSHQQGEWGSHEKRHLGQVIPTDHEDIPSHMASCQYIKLGEGREAHFQ